MNRDSFSHDRLCRRRHRTTLGRVVQEDCGDKLRGL